MKVNIKTVSLPFVLIIVMVMSMLGCSTTTSTPTSTTTPVKTLTIGAVVTITGPLSWLGTDQAAGTQAAIDEINAKGGLNVAGQRYILELQVQDDQNTPDIEASAAKRMTEQGINYIMLGIFSGAVNQVSTSGKVITMAVTDGGPGCLGPNAPYSYVGDPEALNQIYPFILDHIVQTYPSAKIVAFPCFAGEDVVMAPEVEYAKTLGLQWTIYTLDQNLTDLTPLFTKILATNPDVIDLHVSMCAVSQVAQIRQLRQDLGYTGPILCDLMGSEVVAGAAGLDVANGVWGTGPDDPNSKFMSAAEKAVDTKYRQDHPGDKPTIGFWNYYADMHILAAAIEKAGTIDSTAVNDILPSITWEGGKGSYYFGGEKTYGIKHVLCGPASFGEIINGVPVETEREIINVP